MKLTIEANTIEELMEKVCAIANKFNVDLSENTKTLITPEVVKAAEEVAVVEEKKEKKQTKKEKKEEAIAELAAEEIVVPICTKQDVTNACQEVSEKYNLDKAREVLAKFGAKRISEVKEEDYAGFVQACKALL